VSGGADSFDAYVSMRDVQSGADLVDALGGPRQGRVWTPWIAAPSGSARVVFVGKGPVQVSGAASTPGSGVGLAGYEYRRYQSGGRPFSVPLRMPGQYYDAETAAVDNWSRYYDPTNGRYLQPEPMLQGPRGLVALATRGMAPQPYAYVLNNPLHYADPTGEFAVAVPVILVLGGAVIVVAVWEVYVIQCTASGTCPWSNSPTLPPVPITSNPCQRPAKERTRVVGEICLCVKSKTIGDDCLCLCPVTGLKVVPANFDGSCPSAIGRVVPGK